MKGTGYPKITLEQWAAFRSVVDEGSFHKAADALNKSQSTVSYAVARLNSMLPSPALVQRGRKAELTELGKTLYRHAGNLLDLAYGTEEIANYLAQGWESQLTLITDALTPMPVIFDSLQSFSARCKHTRIKILETSLSGTDEALFSHAGELTITPRIPPGFLGDALTTITMIPVAHQHHPLAKLTHITESELIAQRQIVVRDTGTKREQDVGWLGSEQRWTVSHFASSLDAVRAGLGFAFLPRHRVMGDIEAGNLVQLPLQWGSSRQIVLHLVISQPKHVGPATQILAQILRETFLQV